MEHSISRTKSVLILAVATVLMLVIGNLIGYTFYWDQYDTSSSSQKKAALLEEEAVVNPNDTANQLELAWTYYQQEKYDQAKEQFAYLIKQNSKNFEAKYGLASTYMGLKQYAKAEKLLLELQQVDPENDEVLHDLGITLREQSRYAEAEKTLKNGLKLNNISAGMHYDLALVYEKMKNKEEAIVHYQKSIDFVPGFAEAFEGLKRLGIDKYEPEKYH